jgi:hypothetical protein
MNVLEYILRAKDESSAVLQNAKSNISGSVRSVGSELGSLVAKGASVVGVFLGIKNGIQKAFSEFAGFERIQAQFETLLGSADAAAKRTEEIQSFKGGAAGGLFGEEDIAKASMNLEKLTGGVLAGQSAWQMLGDVAAGTGNTMESVSFAVGKAFGQLAEGLPIDRALMQLQQLGVLGPEAIKQLKDLEDAGGTLAQKWEIVSAALEKYNGAMEKQKATTGGAMAELKSVWDEWFQSIGKGINYLLAGPIKALSSAIKVIGEGRLFDFKTWDPRSGGKGEIGDFVAQHNAQIAAEQAKAAEAKRVQDELAKRQIEIDKKLAEEKAKEESKKQRKLADEEEAEKKRAFVQRIQEEKQDRERAAREAEQNRKKSLKESWSDAAKSLIDRAEAGKEGTLKSLDDAIEELGKKAASAAERLRSATTWLSNWGGQADGEFGERGAGRREWGAGLAGARAHNAQQAILDKKDEVRWTELRGRVARGTKLSPEDQQWMNDQRAWAKKQRENADAAKKAAADEAQAKADIKMHEAEKKRIAEETRDACKAIRETVEKTLRAI